MANSNSKNGVLVEFYAEDAKGYDKDRYGNFLSMCYVKAASRIMDDFINNFRIQERKNLLDIAAGSGRVLRSVKVKNIHFIGIDICEEMIDVARMNTSNRTNVSFVIANALELPFKNDAIDIITCTRFVHLISKQDLEKLLSEIIKITKKGGYIFIEGMNLYYKEIFSFRRLLGKAKEDLYLSPRSLRTIDDRLHFINFFGFGFPLVFRILSLFDEETTVKLMIMISKSPLKYVLERWLAVWKKK
ncbi:class I SAM-dependent methyltransferase [bacterium]|nr:class I SAM-dependent methyltransferase [bacterium]